MRLAFWIVFTVAAFVGYTVTYRAIRRVRRARRAIRLRQYQWALDHAYELADQDELGIGA